MQGSDLFASLIEIMVSYVSELLRPQQVTGVGKELYRGVLRILLVLHHDFPEFLADNHFRLCNIIPLRFTQLRNLVLSAFPSSILELPDPFTQGLKIDRLDDNRKAPVIAGDILSPLEHANVKEIIDSVLASGKVTDEKVASIVHAISPDRPDDQSLQQSPELDQKLIHAIVLNIGQSALAANASSGSGAMFKADTPQAVLLKKLAQELQPDARYLFVSAIANQLRYPNTHTSYFSHALLSLFGTDQADQQESDIRQQITRVLLERLIVHRPHPWGLIITLLELLKNPAYSFWELPFIKAAPEVCSTFFLLKFASNG